MVFYPALFKSIFSQALILKSEIWIWDNFLKLHTIFFFKLFGINFAENVIHKNKFRI